MEDFSSSTDLLSFHQIRIELKLVLDLVWTFMLQFKMPNISSLTLSNIIIPKYIFIFKFICAIRDELQMGSSWIFSKWLNG